MKIKNIYKFATTIILVCVIIIVAFFLYNNQKEINAVNYYSNTVTKYGFEYGVDANLILAVMKAESNFDETAVSKKGAKGLMQIMPQTADYISVKLNQRYNGKDLFDYKVNIRYGAYYLKYLTDKYKDLVCVLAAYNAGEGNLSKWLKQNGNEKLNAENIPFIQTRTYVKKVLKYYNKYKKTYNY